MNLIAALQSMNPWKNRKFPRWALISAALLVLLTGAGVSRHAYLVWKEHRLILSARVALDRRDRAALNAALEQALRLNPKNLEACRISGQAMLDAGNAKALPWLRRVVELAPDSLEDQMNLANAAWRFNLTQEAAKWVVTMEPAAGHRADYQDLAGRVAESLGSLAEAREHYRKAVKIEPSNHAYQMRLAIIRLASGDPVAQQEARKQVEELSLEAELKAAGLRALLLDAMKELQTERALRLARELDASPEHLFSDRLLFLQVLHTLNIPEFHDRLAETQEAAAKTPEWILPLLTWMNSDHLSALARDWVLRLPAASVEAVPLRMEIARSYAEYGDWKRLQFFLADEKWGDSDFLKQAYLARCYRERDPVDTASKTTWSEAVNLAGNNGVSLLKLASTARQWGWDSEAEETYWRAATNSNKSVEALGGLTQLYFSKKNAAGLFRVFNQMLEHNPDDPVALNNFANLCGILGRETDRALSVARDLHGKEPKNPVYASTYSFLLHQEGQNAKALEIMEKLAPEELKTPSVAAYYSAFLDAAARAEEARKYRELAVGADLFPEEKQILNIPDPEPEPAAAVPAVTPAPELEAAPALVGGQGTEAPAPAPAPAENAAGSAMNGAAPESSPVSTPVIAAPEPAATPEAPAPSPEPTVTPVP